MNLKSANSLLLLFFQLLGIFSTNCFASVLDENEEPSCEIEEEVNVFVVYDKCKKLGISMELVTNNKSDWKALALDGSDDMTSYVERHTALVNRTIERGMGDVSYSIFQESNARGLGWIESNEPFYLEAYRLAFNAIKQADPSALVVGPNAQWGPWTWWWSEHEGDYTWFIRKFIDYSTDKQCVPDIITWHDGYHCNGFGIAQAAEEIRNYLDEKGIPPIPLEQDDVGCKEGQFRPGTYVSYLANIERAKITYSCKCCWDRDCHINTLQGMLTKTNREPRSLWWMYKSYGDLTGEIVEVAPGNTVDAVVAIDKGADNSEDKPLENPEKTIEQTFKFKNGQIEVILDDLRSFDAYTLTISLSEK